MSPPLRRREFIVLLGGAAWPLAARAQQPRKIYRVGLLVTGVPMGATDKRRQTLLSVLAAHGFVDGQNLVFVQRSADAGPEGLDGLAAELKPPMWMSSSHSAIPQRWPPKSRPETYRSS